MPHVEAPRSDIRQVRYLFSAIIGHRSAKHALMLLAVEPALRGVLLGTSNGSAEAVLARSFASLIPESYNRANDRVEGRRFDEVIELPLNITEDRLLGALDLERTLASGTRVFSPGLLAQTDGRVLCVNDIGLLDSGTVPHLAHAMDSRCVRVERETISTNQSADFLLIGLFNPTDDELPPMLRERVGLIVDSIRESSIEESVVMIDREFLFENDPFGFIDEFILDEAAIKSTIEAARSRLPRVRVYENHIRQIALVAMRLGVEGNRADGFALKAARANAALAGRDEVNEDDIVTAIRFVLAPRATTLPSPEQKQQSADNQPTDNADAMQDARRIFDAPQSALTEVTDELISPIDARVPNELVRLPRRTQPRNHRSGKRLKSLASSRGRYVRSQIHATREAKIAIDATLRAAAPFQIRRRSAAEDRKSDLASPRIKIEPGDLRYKQFKQRSGVLFIFAVDASGSMAINRMAQAKGALLRVLQQAYLHRDKVALISFRGKGAEVLLAPTGSVELAKRLVDSLPTGGGTPISAGVAKAIELARLARLKGMSRAVLVLFTDGRANVIAREGQTIDDELRTLAVALESESIDSVVVDTRARHISSGEANAVAQKLGSRYLYLPRADDAMVYLEVTAFAKQPVN
jgi:magnesium chelatase subunit D